MKAKLSVTAERNEEDEMDLVKKKGLRTTTYQMSKAEEDALERMCKAHNANDLDMDIDDGLFGIGDLGGQVAMRVKHNDKCAGCLSYDHNMSACEKGLVPVVCGDGTFPEIGYAPAQGNRIAAKNWTIRHRDEVVTSSQADQVDNPAEYPYRVEVLGDSALALSERMTLMKAAVQDAGALAGHIWHNKASKRIRDKYLRAEGKDPDKKHVQGKGRPPKAFIERIKQSVKKADSLVAESLTDITGFTVLPDEGRTLLSSKPTVEDFASAMGTTEDIVRAIAQRLGDKQSFHAFIKSKMPDIAQAYGLTEADVNSLYRAATKSISSLSMTDWEAWKGVSFEGGVTDDNLSRAISERGILDVNAAASGSIIAPARPVQGLPEPEPVQTPAQVPIVTSGFVGGNLHLADSFPKG